MGNNRGRPIRYPGKRANETWEAAWVPSEQESPLLPCTGKAALFSSAYFHQQLEAAAMCVDQQCPVITQCREGAIAQDEAWGVWGGMTPGQREDVRTVTKELTHETV